MRAIRLLKQHWKMSIIYFVWFIVGQQFYRSEFCNGITLPFICLFFHVALSEFFLNRHPNQMSEQKQYYYFIWNDCVLHSVCVNYSITNMIIFFFFTFRVCVFVVVATICSLALLFHFDTLDICWARWFGSLFKWILYSYTNAHTHTHIHTATSNRTEPRAIKSIST